MKYPKTLLRIFWMERIFFNDCERQLRDFCRRLENESITLWATFAKADDGDIEIGWVDVDTYGVMGTGSSKCWDGA